MTGILTRGGELTGHYFQLWELRTGKVVRTIPGVGAEVQSIRMAAGNALAITSELTCIRIWSLRSGNLIKTIDEYEVGTLAHLPLDKMAAILADDILQLHFLEWTL